ncbi:hypothetical protein ABZV91_04390 [Nocardia sp. NPDC004568]|uniref:hypothetical protein n=1 Tax=Nocardia sp. NPDC004568 TaxID=3154551 RepID=UPI0033B3D339
MALLEPCDILRDKLTRAAELVAESYRSAARGGAHHASLTLTGADSAGKRTIEGAGAKLANFDRPHSALRHQRTLDHSHQRFEAGARSGSLAELRFGLEVEAHRRLRVNPDAAHEIGIRFKEAMYRGYLAIPSKKRKDPKDARYEAARAWHTAITGIPTDKAMRQALERVRMHAQREGMLRSVIAAESGSVYRGSSPYGPSVEFCEAMSKMLRKPIDEFWRECRRGGKYEAFYAEYLHVRQLDDDVLTRWYEDFKRSMSKGLGTTLTPENFADYLTSAGRDALQKYVDSQVISSSTDIGLFHFASLPQPPRMQAELFQGSIPALDERAMLTRAGIQHAQGEFVTEFFKPDPDEDVLRITALKALGLDEDLTGPLQPRGRKPAGRCPAVSIIGDDGTPTSRVSLQLTHLLGRETYWWPGA